MQVDHNRERTTRRMSHIHLKAAQNRNRLLYGCCMASVIATGLLWRSSLFSLPATVSKYGGDALWSLMVFFGVGLLFPRLSTMAVAALSLIFASLVETSQLYHSPWIDAIRSTRLGALVLGSVFNWPDFPPYILGVLIGAALEFLFRGTNARRKDELG